MPIFADLALFLRISCGGLPREADGAPRGLHVDENRPISGRLGCLCGRPISALQRFTTVSAVCWTLASRRADTRRDGLALQSSLSPNMNSSQASIMPSYSAAVRVSFRDDACQTDCFRTCTMVGTCDHCGLSTVNPTEGAAKRRRAIKRSPRGNLSAGPGANAFRRCLPERAGRPRLRRFSREGLRCRNRRSAP